MRLLSTYSLSCIFFLPCTGAPPPQTTAGLDTLYQKGVAAAKARDYDAAEQAFRSALKLAGSANDQLWTARLHVSIGEILEDRGQFRDAAGEYGQALPYYETVHDQAAAAPVLYRMARISIRLSDFKKAIEYSKRSATAFHALLDNLNEAKSLDVLGQLEARMPDYDAAEAALSRALTLYQGAHDDAGSAKVRGSLADLHRRNSHFAAALEEAFRALDEDERLGELREEAKVLDVIGNSLHKMGQYENALRYYRRALEIREKAHLTQDLNFSYRNIGAALYDLGKNAESLDYYNKSLAMGRAAGNLREVEDSMLNIGVAETALGRTQAARQHLEEALAIAEQNGFRQQQSEILYNLGSLAETTDDLERALDLYQRARTLREEIGDPRGVVLSLNRIAVVLENKSDWQGALKVHERALAQFEKLARQIADPVQAAAFRQTAEELYPHYARTLVKLGRNWDALLISERSRAPGLARLVALNGVAFTDLLAPENANAWRDATAEFARAGNTLRVAAESSTEASGRHLETARARYYEAEKKTSELRDKLFASTPELRAAQAPPPPTQPQLEQMARQAPRTLFVEWMMIDQSVALLFALNSDGLQVFELGQAPSRLAAASDEWRDMLGRAGSRRGNVAAASHEAELARQVYLLAFHPVTELLESGKFDRLVLVAEGPLLDIPFAALITRSGGRLIEHLAVSNTISLNRLLHPPIRRHAPRTLLALADPLKPGERRLAIPSGEWYEPLREAKREAESIAGMYAGAQLLAGASAREASVKRLLPQFEFLHFAAHGVLDGHDGLRSALLLATEPADSPEDGELYAWEVAELSLPARLVVLSACDTGLGKERRGEGLTGMAWAFLASGAPRVVASLWSVDDAATRTLMTAFYRQVLRGTPVDEALRKAMLTSRTDPQFAAPFFWAGFQLLGQGGAL